LNDRSVKRTPLLAANWKMNPVKVTDAVDLARLVRQASEGSPTDLDVILLPPFPWLLPVAEELKSSRLALGAQDCYWEAKGAFTGEVSAAMLAGWCQWVLAGHSERRAHFLESDEIVARKAQAAVELGLRVIICAGESESQYVEARTGEVVTGQIESALASIPVVALGQVVIAYEPVWAIGTGRNADPDQVGKVLSLIRNVVERLAGRATAEQMRLLYGGSVKASNLRSYLDLPGCDGALVGGASLDANEFGRMIDLATEGSRIG
jgi:triosephosphate isomerase (TIM)